MLWAPKSLKWVSKSQLQIPISLKSFPEYAKYIKKISEKVFKKKTPISLNGFPNLQMALFELSYAEDGVQLCHQGASAYRNTQRKTCGGGGDGTPQLFDQILKLYR